MCALCITLLNCPTSIFENVSNLSFPWQMYLRRRTGTLQRGGCEVTSSRSNHSLIMTNCCGSWFDENVQGMVGHGHAGKPCRLNQDAKTQRRSYETDQDRGQQQQHNRQLVHIYRQIILSNSLLWIILVGSCRYLHSETSAPGSLRHYSLLEHDLTWAPKKLEKHIPSEYAGWLIGVPIVGGPMIFLM